MYIDERIAEMAVRHPFLNQLVDLSLASTPMDAAVSGSLCDLLYHILNKMDAAEFENVPESDAEIRSDSFGHYYFSAFNADLFNEMYMLKYLKSVYPDVNYSQRELYAFKSAYGIVSRFNDYEEYTLDDLEEQIEAIEQAIRIVLD